MNFFEKVFSVKNELKHKIIRILGFKIKLHLKHFKKKAVSSRRIQQILQDVNEIIYGLSSNPKDDIIYIFQHTFFNQTGESCIFGGAERYVCDLSELFSSKGYKVVLIQLGTNAEGIWTQKISKMTVIGVNANCNDYLLINGLLPSAKLAIYSGYTDWSGIYEANIHPSSILISHGITWDLPHRNTDIKMIKKTLNNFDNIVSVDTNTISWLRTTYANDLIDSPKNFQYIPNYVDIEKFKHCHRISDTIKITFPRRLCEERGYWLLANNVSAILNKYDNVEIEFIGFIHDRSIENNLNYLMSKFPNKVTHRFVNPENMHEVYQDTDISLIPTLFSEGTSLSCLEAMACGNVVIATNIGGLTNLVIDGYNGLLINPKEVDLIQALDKIITNKKLQVELSSNAIAVAQVFDKQIWFKRWQEFFEVATNDVILKKIKDSYLSSGKPLYIYLTTFSAEKSLKQRPHHILEGLAKCGYTTLWVEANYPNNYKQNSDNYFIVSDTILRGVLDLGFDYIINIYSHHTLSKKQEEFIAKSLNKKIILEHIDDFKIWKDVKVRKKLQKSFKKYCKNKNSLFLTSADSLYEEILKLGVKKNRIIKSHNAVNIEDFACGNDIIPPFMQTIVNKDKPIIGYYGALCDDWFDYDLCEALIQKNKQFEFVFIGPITGFLIERLLKYDNFTHIPPIPYEEIPYYARQFNVAIIPFLLNDITKSTSPVKLFEYFTMGLPVVATPLQECKKYKSVFIAKNVDSFTIKINEALTASSDEQYKRLQSYDLNANTWLNRVSDIDKMLIQAN